MGILARLFGSGDFMPHGYCYQWNTALVWLHVISDSLITLAYLAIPIVLVALARKRRDIPFNWIFVCFGIFIVACGATHALEVWNLWHANYWLSGVVKAVTAVASVLTAVLLIRLFPKALAIPHSDSLNKANLALQEEIRDRQVAEAALHKTEARFRNLLESAPDAMVIVDAKGVIVLSNAQTEKMFGHDRTEILGKPVEMLMPERFRGGHHGHRSAYQMNPHARPMGASLELFGLRKDGSEFPVEISLSPIETDEGILISSSIRDVTRRKKAESELLLAKDELELHVHELADVNRELESFSYSVSHDLRAPVRHIHGFSKILLEDFGERMEPDAKKFVRRIQEATEQMGRLVDDLLNLARLGRQSVSVQITGLGALVQEVLDDLKQEIGERAIEWNIGELPFVECDPSLTKQVFANLISNAVKYTRPREHPRIEIGQIRMNWCDEIFVRDNGVGFNMKYADKLFGVFQRLHRQEDFEGTGVGLATVQRIINKHGGKIRVEAELDKGAAFYFTLGAGANTQAIHQREGSTTCRGER